MHYDAFRYDGPKKMSNREVQIIERKLLHFSFFYASCNHLYKKSTNEKKWFSGQRKKIRQTENGIN